MLPPSTGHHAEHAVLGESRSVCPGKVTKASKYNLSKVVIRMSCTPFKISHLPLSNDLEMTVKSLLITTTIKDKGKAKDVENCKASFYAIVWWW